MRVIGCIVPLPADSNVSIRSPRSEPVRMCAVLSDPSRMSPFITNVTSASPWRSFTSDTVPTFIPDTVTGLPVRKAAGFRKQRLVSDHRRPRDEPVGRQAHEDDHGDEGNADESGLDEPSSAILEH